MGKRNGGFVLGAIIGGAAAAVTALLFAPKSGKELRQDISNEFDDFMDTMYDYKDIAVEKGSELIEVAKETTDDIKVSLKDTSSQLKSQYTETKDKVAQDFRKAKTEVDQAVADIKDSATVGKDIANEVVEEAKAEASKTEEADDLA